MWLTEVGPPAYGYLVLTLAAVDFLSAVSGIIVIVLLSVEDLYDSIRDNICEL